MICPWCSGTGCGSCHGTGETRSRYRWKCPACGASGIDGEDDPMRETCACGAVLDYEEVSPDPEDAFDPPYPEDAYDEVLE